MINADKQKLAEESLREHYIIKLYEYRRAARIRHQPRMAIDELENQPPKAIITPTPQGNNTYYDMYVRKAKAFSEGLSKAYQDMKAAK